MTEALRHVPEVPGRTGSKKEVGDAAGDPAAGQADAFMSTTRRDIELVRAITEQAPPPEPPEWWRGAIFYEVYVHSFNDTTGNGLGDLPGVLEKMDYIADLGVDGLWLTPFYESPQEDSGYDISSFRTVDERFGSLDDVRALVAAAHERDLKVIVDFILGHTSDQHPWFQQSAGSRDNAKADWYVWADGDADGGAPNNWLSSFGGRAWRWEPRRAQYVYRPFLESQPALNLANPEVMSAMKDRMRFWLDLGIDGFRLDAVQCLAHDLALRSNPPAVENENPSVGGGPNNPFKRQIHLFDRDVPEAIEILRQIRSVADEYQPSRALIGELADVDSSRLAPKYTVGPNRLHAVYDFDLIHRTETLADWTETLGVRARYLVPGASFNVFTNHDSQRAVSHLMPEACGKGCADEAAKLLLFLQATLMGGAIVFQGEELGLEQPELREDQIRDPWAKALWPDFAGRDGVRCPMPWDASMPNGGFSEADNPWYDMPEAHVAKAVDRQLADEHSVLRFARRLLAWRREHPMLRVAGNEMLAETPDGVIGYTRRLGEDILICVANFALRESGVTLPRGDLRIAFGGGGHALDGCRLHLGGLAFAALVPEGT